MKAIVIENFGGPEQLVMKDVPVPTAGAGEVLIRVRALGINRAETYFRKGAWGDVVRISGIECVGEIVDDPAGLLQSGETVAAIMGGMGRTRNGSYAEYVCVLATNVFRLNTGLDWSALAAIPESYATAWSCLYHNLNIDSRPGGVLVVRGGTSALGQAAINLARHAGLKVIASTRSESKLALLTGVGATHALVDDGSLSAAIHGLYPEGVDFVLELVGSSTLVDSLAMARKNGKVCMAGFLGGGAPISLEPLGGIPVGVDFNFYGSFVLGTKDFPLSDIPMQAIVDGVEAGLYSAKPVKVFDFADLPDAHRLMESDTANGKIVVVVPI